MEIRKIYDITQPLFECEVFPGDNSPVRKQVLSIENGSLYNLTEFSMCAHNGTHVDAPRHFFQDGIGIDKINLSKFIGPCFIVQYNGYLSGNDAKLILGEAATVFPGSQKRILLKGDVTVTAQAAEVFAEAKADLIGNESQSVGPIGAPMQVHLILLSAGTVLLEGIRLSGVPEGCYLLSCAPLNLSDCDGSPCRAILIDCL